MSESAAADAAWLVYRDEYTRRMHLNPKRAGSQMRKREFVAGFLAASQPTPSEAGDEAVCDCESMNGRFGSHREECALIVAQHATPAPSPGVVETAALVVRVLAALDEHPHCSFKIADGAHFECGIEVLEGRVRDARRKHLEIVLARALGGAR